MTPQVELDSDLDGFRRVGGQEFRIWSISRLIPCQSGTIGISVRRLPGSNNTNVVGGQSDPHIGNYQGGGTQWEILWGWAEMSIARD